MGKIYFIIFCCFGSLLHAQHHYPGGVPGAEVWYMATHDDLQNGEYNDYSGNDVTIRPCTDEQFAKGLFNFNPSIAETFCLQYHAPLEEALTHNVFMVSEPLDEEYSYSHINTRFNHSVPSNLRDSLSRNTYVLETKQGYASRLTTSFNQHQRANVHFYSWSNYDSDKKFKSYGQIGETEYHLGKHFPFPYLDDGQDFEGLFPEYISFDRALTDNERNRVESYLALKYGITLDANRSYKNSQNKVFWDKQNNALFGNNIFGIGRDDLSGLNQLQCESAHNRDYLVAGTLEIQQTNAEAQEHNEIANHEFLVFGDTGGEGLSDPNEQNLQLLEKVWLAQVTGEEIRDVPIHFRLSLNNEFDPYIGDIEGEVLVVWMLHDRYVDNSYVSDFDNGNVDYYKPIDIEFTPTGEAYAHYRAEVVRFDGDHNFFDQYTFAVGPEIIIQVRYMQWQCEGECYGVEVVVIGGEPGYEVVLVDENGEETGLDLSHEEEGDGEEQATKFIYPAEVCGDQEYTVYVHDANGTYAEYTFYVEAQNHTLDLGPDQNLDANQTSVLIDAGQGIDDPNATYVWYYNEEQIYHTGSTLDADLPGQYCVVVTTSDMTCQLEDCIIITNNFECNINSGSGCDEGENYIEVEVLGGVPPYTTHVIGNGMDFKHTHNGNTIITDLPYTYEDISYWVTVTDSLGATCVTEVSFQETGSWGSLGPNQMLTISQQTISLDGTIPFGSNPDYTYQWYHNGTLLSNTNPQLTISIPGNYQVEVTFPDGCIGKAGITIGYNIEGSIDQHSGCDEASNTLDIIIDYGIPPYEVTIAEHPSGTVYYTNPNVMGSITQSGMPYGDYTVTVTDDYGGVLYQQVSFTGLQLNIHEQLQTLTPGCGWGYNVDECGNEIPFIDTSGGCPFITLDASTLINTNQNVSYEWFIYGNSLGIFTPTLSFEETPYDEGCLSLNYPFYDPQHICQPQNGGICTVVIKDNTTGCSISQSFTFHSMCPVLNNPAPRPTLTTKIYPNPSDPSATFYYEVSSEENFHGMVRVYDLTGSVIHEVKISGDASYTLPFSLLASGTYFICTETRGTLTTDKVIIK